MRSTVFLIQLNASTHYWPGMQRWSLLLPALQCGNVPGTGQRPGSLGALSNCGAQPALSTSACPAWHPWSPRFNAIGHTAIEISR